MVPMSTDFPSRVCLIDDDMDFSEFLRNYIRVQGAECCSFSSAEAFLSSDTMAQPDFFVVDLGLPGIDGVDLITLIRAANPAGILVVSGRMGPDAFNSALLAGADMFINKPVRFDQIYHAIRSVWRRTAPQQAGTASVWFLAADAGSLKTPAGIEIALTAQEGRLMRRLMQAGEDPVLRAELADAAGVSGAADSRNVDSAIFRLRRKLEREGGVAPPFKTIHGVGYQLVEPVKLDVAKPKPRA